LPFKKKSQTQLTVLSVILILAMLLYTVRVYSIQIKNASDYITKNDSAASVLTAVLKAPRGEILDCYGRQIAINRDGYNIVFNKAYVRDNLNDVILTLVNLMESHSAEWMDELPMEKTAPYGFIKDGKTEKLIKTLELAHYATAKNCFDEMTERYGLEKYSDDEKRKIMGVRYSMTIADFSVSYPYTFAEDIPTELMLKVSESAFCLNGVTVEVVPFREYTDTSLAVNLIGTVGPIFAEDWDKYKEKGYSYNDKVGKSGIEAYAEEYLRGTDGQLTYYLDTEGNIIGKEVTKEPIAGKTIMLTLDKKMQRRTQNTLEEVFKKLKSQGSPITGAAAVAVKIDSAEILCAANYPTYDIATMGEEYNKLQSDPTRPLTNRAFQGVYPIGSTIKPAVAVAALENGHYTQGETIKCVRQYSYFADYKPHCMHYHGFMNLTSALSKSCNYFFFELGRRVGAVTLTDYFKQFGLGTKTGVEVDDSAGIIVEPSSNSFGGHTLQISIGQMYAFTPLQLANYVATLANGGTHYRATLVNKIVSYDMATTYEDRKPEVQNVVEISDATIKAVKEGMLSVTEDGTGRGALGDYPLKVGGKSGTSQVENKADHSVFVAFAPFDSPEIAVAVVLEHGKSSYNAALAVRGMLDTYFFTDSTDAEELPFTVLQ